MATELLGKHVPGVLTATSEVRSGAAHSEVPMSSLYAIIFDVITYSIVFCLYNIFWEKIGIANRYQGIVDWIVVILIALLSAIVMRHPNLFARAATFVVGFALNIALALFLAGIVFHRFP